MVFTITASPSGIIDTVSLGRLEYLEYYTNPLSRPESLPNVWQVDFGSLIIAFTGSTAISTGPAFNQTASYTMTINSGVIYKRAYDGSGQYVGLEQIGELSFPSFSTSGTGAAYWNLNGSLAGVQLYEPAEFKSFVKTLDFEFSGSNSNDRIEGQLFSGPGGSATIYGGGGDDTLYGSYEAANTVYGGSGNDYAEIFVSGTTGSAITNNVYGGAGSDVLYVFDDAGDSANIYGGAGDDVLVGAFDGEHVLSGGAGNDTLQSENGGVAVFSGPRAAYAIFETSTQPVVQDRRASSPDGSDTVGAFLDRLRFSDGTFTLESLIGFGVTVTGTAGADVITPTATVTGQALPSDVIDTLYGNGGNDTLDGGLGSDFLYGGTGNDAYYVDPGYAGDPIGDRVIETSAANGVDTVLSASTTYTLGAHVENLTLLGGAGITAYGGVGNGLANLLRGNALRNQLDGAGGNDSLYGDADDDVLLGGIGNDQLFGGSGADFLDGDVGNDRLDGGTGADSMFGGAGSDTYLVDNAGDIVAENQGGATGGTDTVLSSVNYNIGNFGGNVENLTLTGAAAIGGTGDNAANVLTGNGAANTLSGLDGADTIAGLQGADLLSGGFGADRFVFAATTESSGAARDRIVAGGGAAAFEGAGLATGDLISLSGIDANTSVAGNQAFVFFGTNGANGAGRLSLTVLGTDTLLRGNVDADADFELQIRVADGGVLPTSYRATDFIL